MYDLPRSLQLSDFLLKPSAPESAASGADPVVAAKLLEWELDQDVLG